MQLLPSFLYFSTLQVTCKLLEHIVCSNIMAHLDEYKLLSDRQHAFRKGHSCETQLTTVINDWAKILANRGEVDTFILDYEKALVWDPSGVVLQEELESVQKRAARFVKGNYNYETGSMTGILGQLKWESLKKRRKDNRPILLYKAGL